MSESTTGHNNPPSLIEFSAEVVDTLSKWLEDHPVIDTAETARDAKPLVDRASLCLKDMEDERKGHTAPLRDRIKEIDDRYRSPRTILERVVAELRERIGAFIKREEKKRLEAAAQAREAREEAERRAREAEERESAAKKEAELGVSADLGALTRDADHAYQEFRVAQRAAARAEMDTAVKVGGGHRRALSLRTHIEIEIVSPDVALRAVGWTERLLQTLMKEVNDHYRVTGQIPAGTRRLIERRA